MRSSNFWSALKWAGQIVALLLTAAFLVLDVVGFRQIGGDGREVGWQWLALAAFVVFVVQIYWLVLQQQGEISRFKNTRAPLEVYFDPEDPGTFWPEEHWYRIGVRNESHFVQAQDTIATLEKMTPYALPFKALPSKLGVKDGGVKCTINPEGYALFDVVSRVPDTERALAIWIEGSPGQKFELDPNVEYGLLIVVSAANHEEPKPMTIIMKHPLGQDPEFSIRP
jgi:hypothetical protein